MLCDICHENEAVINFTEITSEGRKDIHLCQTCAAKESAMQSPFVSLTNTGFLANLLSSVLGIKGEETGDDEGDENLKKTNIVCPSCRMTYNEFLKFGKFGCSECYKTFNFLLDSYLKKIQGNVEHTGKRPVFSGETVNIPKLDLETESGNGEDREPINITVDAGSSIEELKAALKRAVAREEYEEAARIRDMIRAEEGAKEHA